MRAAADEAGVHIVTGDTKVVEGSGGMYITTAGVAHCSNVPQSIACGDAIIISGTLGEHHACILSQRMGIANDIQSDAAPLVQIVDNLRGLPLHGIRDITRGGLATVLHELATAAGLRAEISPPPVSRQVDGLCKILGLDPLYMGCEGRMLFTTPASHAARVCEAIKAAPYGENAAIIGSFTEGSGVVMRTKLGGLRRVPPLAGEGLPRIC
jgi:hydrogenase expression/formation protein HypE